MVHQALAIKISDKKSENPKEISLIKDLEQHQDEMVPIALIYSLFTDFLPRYTWLFTFTDS